MAEQGIKPVTSFLKPSQDGGPSEIGHCAINPICCPKTDFLPNTASINDDFKKGCVNPFPQNGTFYAPGKQAF